jgi:hypothetical protein
VVDMASKRSMGEILSLCLIMCRVAETGPRPGHGTEPRGPRTAVKDARDSVTDSVQHWQGLGVAESLGKRAGARPAPTLTARNCRSATFDLCDTSVTGMWHAATEIQDESDRA